MPTIQLPNPADSWKPRRREIPLDPQLAAAWAEAHEAIEIVRPRCPGFSDDMIYRHLGGSGKVRMWMAPCGMYPPVAVYLRSDLEAFSMGPPPATASPPVVHVGESSAEPPAPKLERHPGPEKGKPSLNKCRCGDRAVTLLERRVVPPDAKLVEIAKNLHEDPDLVGRPIKSALKSIVRVISEDVKNWRNPPKKKPSRGVAASKI